MELNKENIKRIIFIIAISLIIFWGLNHYDIIFDGAQYGISIFSMLEQGTRVLIKLPYLTQI